MKRPPQSPWLGGRNVRLLSVSPRGEDGETPSRSPRGEKDDVRCKMGNPHVDSVERNGVGIFHIIVCFTVKGEP